MERYDAAMIEWYWAPSPGKDPNTFHPSFTVFFSNGHTESHAGSNAEVTRYLAQLGAQGFRVTSAVSNQNWILWTLDRRT
ncbi:MAG: hypothetical protein IT377_11575 [Polyangiaceae bacterium]|nr:hypothetical protein [Polyangiaceae bacterium]